MVFPLVLAASVLASPPPAAMLDALPKGALFHAVPVSGPRAGGELAASAAVSSGAEPDAVWGWLDQLAVVRPHRRDRHAPPSLQMFIALTVVKDEVGVRAFGSF